MSPEKSRDARLELALHRREDEASFGAMARKFKSEFGTLRRDLNELEGALASPGWSQIMQLEAQFQLEDRR